MERLKISTSVGLFRVPTDDIAYIEASGNYCDVHLFNGESVTMTFQLHYFVEVLGMLQQNFFLRVGKSLIVNKNFVYAINVTNQELKLMDYRAHHSFRLKASKEALKELKSVLELLLSAKLQNDTISLSATPINRRCGFLFRKVSPP